MPSAIPGPCLCLVTDRSIIGETDLVERVAEAVTGGVNLVQLREKDLPGGKLLEMAGQLRQAIGDGALLLINERVDVALAAGAAGVQLGEDALPVSAARRILGPEAIIGRSVHSLKGAIQAVADGADFLLVGTVYPTRSHPGSEPAGPQLVRRIAATCAVPIIGIGGINHINLAPVLQAGATGVAVISSILSAPNPRTAAQELKQALLSAWPGPRDVKGGYRNYD